jgi:hypothetical protein
MSNNAKIGGVLSLVSGGLGFIGATILLIVSLAYQYADRTSTYYYDGYYSENALLLLTAIYIFFSVVGLVLGALAIVGGIFALKRRLWGLALTGSIASCLTFLPCGVPAVVFMAMAKPEFSANRPSAP